MADREHRLLARRDFLRYLTVGAGAGVLAACAPAAPAPTAAPAKPAESKPAEAAKPADAAKPAESKPAEAAKPAAAARSNGMKLTVWGWQSFTPEGDRALGDQMKEWGSANRTEVEYVVVENAQFPQKLAAAVEARAAPDVVMLTQPSNVLDYAGRELFADLADVWRDVSRQAGGFVKYVESQYNIGNAYFAIPFEADTSPLFTRLDLVEQATGRREPPKTLDELTEAARKINQPPALHALGLCLGRVPDCESDAINTIWNDGGTLVDKDGRVALNSPETVAAMKRLKGWWDDKLIPPGATTWDDTGNNSAYQAKQVAFVRNPPSIYAWMQTNDKELLENSTMAPYPAGASGSYASSGAWSWSVFNTTRNAEGAKDLLRHLMDPQRLQTVYAAVGGRWYPIYVDGQKDEYWTSRPHFRFYPELLAGGRGFHYPAQPDPKLMAAIGEARNRNIIADMVQDIVVKGVTPEEAVKKAHDAMVEVFRARGANA